MTDTQITSRIGIYAGTFNPVHSGHIAFALQAVQAANLDMVYFMPERRPREKQTVEHFGHRMAMLSRATEPHAKLELLDLVDVNFSVNRTLPQLQQEFPDSQLVFLVGSDVAPSLPSWPHIEQLLKQSELVIGVRAGDDMDDLKTTISSWELAPLAVTIFDSYAPTVSSRIIREALQKRQPTHGLLPSVQRYSDRHWLYVSVV
jgi:nicotinate-nucleotide adenylyltransferase